MGILDPIKPFPSHPSEEILEEYVFHRLPEVLTAHVEEHLLICQSCQDAVTETEQFVSALKVTARQPGPDIGPVASRWRKGLEALPRFSNLAPVLALAVLALVVLWQRPQEPSAPVAVSLSALRGTDPLSPAAAGKPLLLSIEAPDLASGREYRVEVVDTAGRPIWKGAVAQAGGKLLAQMPKPLSNGVYWVRLYGPDSEPVKEFGLSAK